jgi:hypothetical protein
MESEVSMSCEIWGLQRGAANESSHGMLLRVGLNGERHLEDTVIHQMVGVTYIYSYVHAYTHA